jgi:hypothetical protein
LLALETEERDLYTFIVRNSSQKEVPMGVMGVVEAM